MKVFLYGGVFVRNATNKTYDRSVWDRANSPFSKRLQELITDPAALANHLGCTVQAINQYKQGTAFPKTENLIKIADFYQVSVDYLLGITNVQQRDTSLQAVNMVTGLSVGAICKLNRIKDNDKELSDVISVLIENSNCEYLLALVRFILERPSEESGNLLELNLEGQPMKIYDVNLVKALLQTRIIENLSHISNEYLAIKQKGDKKNG
ncbi:MAG: helix-turn-helix transcriptional regulator [Clostridia bacterium]|nr:helix-turn-helix transcriptional regulator [Clostridia bacterium]